MRRLSSAAMQPSIACASPGARVQEQSTCALLLLHRGTVCMSPGAPAHMRAAAGLRTYARAAARAQPVHIHGFSCTLPRLHRDDAESGSYDQRGLLLTWCACTHAVSCVFVLAAWRHAYMHKSRCVLGFLHARHAGGSHVPTTQPSRARTSPGARRRTCTQELPCAASPPRQCCQHDSQATRRAAARCPHGDMRAHAGAAVDLRVVSSPRISIGPAGSRINRDHARRGWATETGHPSWGPRDPRQDKLCAASPPRRSRCGRPRFARRQVRTHASDRDCVSSPQHRVHIPGAATCCFSAGRRRPRCGGNL